MPGPFDFDNRLIQAGGPVVPFFNTLMRLVERGATQVRPEHLRRIGEFAGLGVPSPPAPSPKPSPEEGEAPQPPLAVPPRGPQPGGGFTIELTPPGPEEEKRGPASIQEIAPGMHRAMGLRGGEAISPTGQIYEEEGKRMVRDAQIDRIVREGQRLQPEIDPGLFRLRLEEKLREGNILGSPKEELSSWLAFRAQAQREVERRRAAQNALMAREVQALQADIDKAAEIAGMWNFTPPREVVPEVIAEKREIERMRRRAWVLHDAHHSGGDTLQIIEVVKPSTLLPRFPVTIMRRRDGDIRLIAPLLEADGTFKKMGIMIPFNSRAEALSFLNAHFGRGPLPSRSSLMRLATLKAKEVGRMVDFTVL